LVIIDPSQGIEKCNIYLKKIEELKKLNNKEGTEELTELDQKIRSFVNVSFDDAKDKLEKYNPNPFWGITTSQTEKEIEKENRNKFHPFNNISFCRCKLSSNDSEETDPSA